MKRNLVTRTVGSLLILRQSEEAPSDVEWNETIKQLQQENERITSEFQIKIDLQEQEITALRSQLNQKTKEFSGLSRTVHSMIISARNIVSLGAHGMNLVARDAVSDKIVTQLRGHPQRPVQPADEERVGGDPYAPIQRQAAR